MSSGIDRLFVWVWRINGLLVLLLGLLLLFIVVESQISMTSIGARPEPVARVGDTDLAARELRLGEFNSVAGTDYLYAQLTAPPSSVSFSSGGGIGSTHNALFLETTTKNAHWLLDGNDQTLPSLLFLTDPPGSPYTYRTDPDASVSQVTTAILLEIESKPPQTQRPARRLAVASPDGRNLKTIADPIDELLGHHTVNKTSVLVFYSSGGTAKVLELDPVAREVRSDSVLTAKP